MKYKILISQIFVLYASVTAKAADINDTMARIGDLYYTPFGKVVERTYLPFLDDSYVPQGVATTPQGNIVYQAYYFKSLAEEIGQSPYPAKKPSAIAEFTDRGQTFSRVFQLKKKTGAWFYGHTGGLAHLNGNLYITVGGGIYRFKLSDAKRVTGNKYTLQQCDQYNLNLEGKNSTNSGLDISRFNDANIAWVSEYSKEKDKWILGYSVNKSTGDISTNAIASFKMPLRYVQGVAYYENADRSYGFYFVTSWETPSRGATIPSYAKGLYKVPYYGITEGLPQKIMDLPRGCQDPAYDAINNKLWIASESGARCYLSWEDFFPFVFCVNP